MLAERPLFACTETLDGFGSYLGQTLCNATLNMSIDLYRWAKEYDNVFDDSPIRYTESTGTEIEETDARLNNISRAIQQRPKPHIDRQELRSIGEWKTGGRRIDHHLRSNAADEVVAKTEAAFVRDACDADRVEALTDLTGVGVPVASAILTMYSPDSFAVIDFRALRALAAVRSSLVDTSDYSAYAAFVRWLLNYQRDSRVYEEYMSEIRAVAREQNLSTREVDMALWTFDRENA